MARWLGLLVIFFILAAVAGGMIMGPKGVPVDVVTATQGPIREYIEEQGKTRVPEIYQVTMPLQGRILPITLKEGDTVAEGQIVARMDTTDLETDLVERSNTATTYAKSLEQIDLTIQQADHTVEASQAQYDFAERAYSRTKSLADTRSVSQEELESDELLMTKAALDLSKDKLNRRIYVIMKSIVGLLKDTEVAKQQRAERDRDRAAVRSPVTGVILSRAVSNERVLAAGEVLMEIGQPDLLQVEVDVLTQDVVKLQLGDPVDIEGPAIGKVPVKGRVSKIYPQGFTKVSSLGVEQQRVKTLIDFNSAELSRLVDEGRVLGVDYRVRVKIYTDEKQDAVIIPRGALFRSMTGTWEVFVIREGKAVRMPVEVGLQNDFQVEIVSGVTTGDVVIVAPDSQLEDGSPVDPQPIQDQS